MKNKVIRATAGNNTIRAFVANTTNMVQKAMDNHQATPVAIAALGRTLTITSIMGLMLKADNQKITVKINGKGPLGTILTVGDAKGNVKGYVDYPQVEGSNIRPGKLNVGESVGTQGEITVIKDLGLRDPYIGTYPLQTGEIGDDFSAYFLYSEQQPSSVGLGVLIDVDYSIKAAGGFVIQVMPDIEEETLAKLEGRLTSIEPVTTLIEKYPRVEDILSYILEGLGPRVLEEYEVDFQCDCSHERLERALISIGKEDLKEIIEEDGQAELVCHFCNEKYHFDKEELTALLKQIEQ